MMFMPLLFGFFCYNFAAALALYYTMQGLLTILQLYLTRSQNSAGRRAGGVEVLKPVPVGGGKGKNPNFGGRKDGFPKKSDPMNPTPQELLDTALGHLGYAFDIQEDVAADGTITLQSLHGRGRAADRPRRARRWTTCSF